MGKPNLDTVLACFCVHIVKVECFSFTWSKWRHPLTLWTWKALNGPNAETLMMVPVQCTNRTCHPSQMHPRFYQTLCAHAHAHKPQLPIQTRAPDQQLILVIQLQEGSICTPVLHYGCRIITASLKSDSLQEVCINLIQYKPMHAPQSCFCHDHQKDLTHETF
jgi:hypothetical protein